GRREAPGPYEDRALRPRGRLSLPGRPLVLGGERVEGRGAAEVVLYSPEHDASRATLGREGIRRVVDLWAERTARWLERPELEYVLVFENRGELAGATIAHPHGQIYAYPFVPPVPAREAR